MHKAFPCSRLPPQLPPCVPTGHRAAQGANDECKSVVTAQRMHLDYVHGRHTLECGALVVWSRCVLEFSNCSALVPLSCWEVSGEGGAAVAAGVSPLAWVATRMRWRWRNAPLRWPACCAACGVSDCGRRCWDEAPDGVS
jgi:hypothetical protein